MDLANRDDVNDKQFKGRKRKSNYTEDEDLFLADKLDEMKYILESKHKDVNTNRKKKDAWELILTQHRARFPTANRTVEDLKNRLSKLKSESKDRVQQYKKSRNQTGGGKSEPGPSAAQQKIIDLCEDTPAFQGLDGVESGVKPTCSNAEDEVGGCDATESEEPSVSVPSTLKNPVKQDPPAKVPRKFDDLIDLERENILIKRQNLLLEQEKLNLQIALLKRQLGNVDMVQSGENVFFNL